MLRSGISQKDRKNSINIEINGTFIVPYARDTPSSDLNMVNTLWETINRKTMILERESVRQEVLTSRRYSSSFLPLDPYGLSKSVVW